MTRPWTNDEVAALVRALREGATYSECAAMFGRTIGAIAGCVRRYKEGTAGPPAEPPPATFRVSLLALSAGMCKWPVANAPDLVGRFAFCAQPVGHQGAVYCNHHRRLATTAASTKAQPRTERRAA